MRTGLKFIISGLAATLLLMAGCRKDWDKISTGKWNPIYTLPFIQTELRLGDIMPADSNLNTAPDSSLYYAYHADSVFSITGDSLIQLPENTLDTGYLFSLGTLAVDTFSVAASFSLNQALPYLDPVIRDSLLAHDQSLYVFPSFTYNTPFTIELAPIDIYRTLTFSNGYMLITATNTLPVTLQNINFSLNDVSNNLVLKTVSIELLNSGETFTDTLFLKGLTLGNSFSYVVNGFSAQGSYPDSVFIDLSQGLSFLYEAKNLEVIRGTSKIPQQIMYSANNIIDFSTLEGEKLYRILFSQGSLNYSLQSELPMRVYIELKLPTALVNGVIPHADIVLNSEETVTDLLPLEGMMLNLDSDTLQPFNRFPVYTGIVILPTDEMITFDSSDKVTGYFSAGLAKPAYMRGYFGKKTFTIEPSEIDLDFSFLQKVQGEIILDNPEMTLRYTNGFGVPLKILPQFQSVNNETGNTADLDMDTIVVRYPEEEGSWVVEDISVNKTNSKIVDFLSVRPDKVKYSGGGLTNWNNDSINFIYDTSSLVAGVDILLPLVISADNLRFTDTVSISATGNGFPVRDADFKVLLENGFPFQMHLYFDLADSLTGETLNSLDMGEIAAAPVDASGRVTNTVKDSLTVSLDETFFNDLKRADRGIFRAKSSTFNNGNVPVGLYSDYRLKIAIGFMVHIKP